MEGLTEEQKQEAIIIKEGEVKASSNKDKGKERVTIEEVLEDESDF